MEPDNGNGRRILRNPLGSFCWLRNEFQLGHLNVWQRRIHAQRCTELSSSGFRVIVSGCSSLLRIFVSGAQLGKRLFRENDIMMLSTDFRFVDSPVIFKWPPLGYCAKML